MTVDEAPKNSLIDTAELYDFNFCLPVPKPLESERVKLVPFNPSKYARAFFTATLPYPELYKYLPFGPYETFEEFYDSFIGVRQTRSPGSLLFAVHDKTTPSSDYPDGALAGALGFLNTVPEHLVSELGNVIIFPEFQRTHVAGNAIGLLLHYALDLPSDGGLGLRRMVWKANLFNQPSIRAAEKMGYKQEGIVRWDQVLLKGKGKQDNGKRLRGGDPMEGRMGRDTVVLSLCWDDWEAAVSKQVDEIMARKK